VEVDVQDGPRQAAAILGGSAILAPFSFQHVIEASLKGGGLIAVAMAYYNYPWSLVLSNAALKKFNVTENMPATDLAKLKGAKIGITSPGSSTDQFIRFLLRSQKIDPDTTVQLTPVAPGAGMVAALERGAIDGFIWGSPFPEMTEKKGIGKIAIDGGSGRIAELSGFPYLVWATSKDTLQANRKIVFAASRALAKASIYAHEHPNETREIVRKEFPQMGTDDFNTAFDSFLRGIPTDISLGPQQIAKNVSVIKMASSTPRNLDPKVEDVVSPVGKEAQESLRK
jgi:ABC-type nitrate/sulfonate/bicarbonate transport system substrate-binding protein